MPLQKYFVLVCVIFCFVILWFVPWVGALHLGVVITFPYHADGNSRFLRAVGPLPGLWNREWVSAEALPKSCTAAIVAAEDTRFYAHSGVDWDAIQKSRQANKEAKKVKRGGSTITQQLVKNLFLSRNRSYLRKVREISGALILDAIASKQTQLTWYLNVIEFGPETYGLSQAAQHYFHKEARKLSPAECVALVAVVPSPNKWNLALEKKALTPFLRRRMHTIVRRMVLLGQLPAKEISVAGADSLFVHSQPAVSHGTPAPIQGRVPNATTKPANNSEKPIPNSSAQPVPDKMELEPLENDELEDDLSPLSDTDTSPNPSPTKIQDTPVAR